MFIDLSASTEETENVTLSSFCVTAWQPQLKLGRINRLRLGKHLISQPYVFNSYMKPCLFFHSSKRSLVVATNFVSVESLFCLTRVDDDELMLNVLRCHLTY